MVHLGCENCNKRHERLYKQETGFSLRRNDVARVPNEILDGVRADRHSNGIVGDYEVVAYAIDDARPKGPASAMTFSKESRRNQDLAITSTTGSH